MKKIVLATKNKNKLKEINSLFKSLLDIEVVLPDDDFEVDETGLTFLENASLKASAAAKKMNLPALADDSGLCVDALDGRPGVYSSRYEKDDDSRINKLLKEISLSDKKSRKAHFCCAMALSDKDGNIFFSAEGICEGEIIDTKKGSNGFGYDPVFFIPELNKTLAEIPMEEKNKISHRSKALSKVIDFLKTNN